MGLFSAIAMAVYLQSVVVVVNCAPEYFNRKIDIVARSNTPSTNGTNGTTTTTPPPSSSAPRAVYNGSYPGAHQQGVYIRIANGGAGQAGLIGAWADAFIQSRVAQGDPPFEVAWYLGDTTQSLAMLAEGTVDVAVTYNAAAEKRSMDTGAAVRNVYAFRDHFMLVGPTSNPAELKDDDDIFTMFNKLVSTGNRDVTTPPDTTVRPASRFLSRFDKSATNIKESEIFVNIGQVPWAYDYSKWYHQYPRFPKEALEAASFLSEYTITDLGTWLSASDSVKSRLKIYKQGSNDASDPLLNPAHLLLGARASSSHGDLCKAFVDWVIASDGGQAVVRTFAKNGQVLYSEAP